jgi:hypothetical protein
MKVAASKGDRILGVFMLVAALVYLSHFVPRGWIPHDEGMLGQGADYILRGGIPHIDYEEPYTGGLSWLYAALFRISGVDLLHVRWLLFVGASWATWLMYAIFRRYLRPTGAALATWVALAWSFPNYFAGLPSWWLLICALACVWAVIRYVETRKWRALIAAGLAVGVAIAIKQTGVYLLVALVLSLLHDGDSNTVSSWLASVERLVRWGAGVSASVIAVLILAPRVFHAEGLYLLVPAVACAMTLFRPVERDAKPSHARSPLAQVLVATAVAALPLACLLTPYAARHRLWDFVHGSFFLPRERLAFASAPMPDVRAIITGVPLLALVFAVPRSGSVSRAAILPPMLWATAILLPIVALWNVLSYQIIWQSSRAFAALVPVAICWRLASGRIRHPEQRAVLFVSAAMLAWASLNQFPFAAPVYFSYVAPLAVVAAVAAASAESRLERRTLLPWAAMLLLFAVVSSNRAYIESLGAFHAPRRFDSALDLPRAHLKLGRSEAQEYRRLVLSIDFRLRAGGGPLIAGPDCPEVYFLAGQINPSGTLFEFFSQNPIDRGADEDIAAWSRGEVIVLNHAPHFSVPLSERLTAKLRREFPSGEDIGRFELRWR